MSLVNGDRAIDSSRERETAAALESAWQCELVPFGTFAPVDYYATRDGRPLAVIEIKGRNAESSARPTVFITVQKWLALHMASVGLNIAAVFVMRFTNEIRWINISHIDARRIRLAGRTDRQGFRNDIEPVIDFEVARMSTLKAGA